MQKNSIQINSGNVAANNIFPTLFGNPQIRAIQADANLLKGLGLDEITCGAFSPEFNQFLAACADKSNNPASLSVKDIVPVNTSDDSALISQILLNAKNSPDNNNPENSLFGKMVVKSVNSGVESKEKNEDIDPDDLQYLNRIAPAAVPVVNFSELNMPGKTGEDANLNQKINSTSDLLQNLSAKKQNYGNDLNHAFNTAGKTIHEKVIKTIPGAVSDNNEAGISSGYFTSGAIGDEAVSDPDMTDMKSSVQNQAKEYASLKAVDKELFQDSISRNPGATNVSELPVSEDGSEKNPVLKMGSFLNNTTGSEELNIRNVTLSTGFQNVKISENNSRVDIAAALNMQSPMVKTDNEESFLSNIDLSAEKPVLKTDLSDKLNLANVVRKTAEGTIIGNTPMRYAILHGEVDSEIRNTAPVAPSGNYEQAAVQDIKTSGDAFVQISNAEFDREHPVPPITDYITEVEAPSLNAGIDYEPDTEIKIQHPVFTNVKRNTSSDGDQGQMSADARGFRIGLRDEDLLYRVPPAGSKEEIAGGSDINYEVPDRISGELKEFSESIRNAFEEIYPGEDGIESYHQKFSSDETIGNSETSIKANVAVNKNNEHLKIKIDTRQFGETEESIESTENSPEEKPVYSNISASSEKKNSGIQESLKINYHDNKNIEFVHISEKTRIENPELSGTSPSEKDQASDSVYAPVKSKAREINVGYIDGEEDFDAVMAARRAGKETDTGIITLRYANANKVHVNPEENKNLKIAQPETESPIHEKVKPSNKSVESRDVENTKKLSGLSTASSIPERISKGESAVFDAEFAAVEMLSDSSKTKNQPAIKTEKKSTGISSIKINDISPDSLSDNRLKENKTDIPESGNQYDRKLLKPITRQNNQSSDLTTGIKETIGGQEKSGALQKEKVKNVQETSFSEQLKPLSENRIEKLSHDSGVTKANHTEIINQISEQINPLKTDARPISKIEIQLKPAELGAIDVTLKMDKNGTINAIINAEKILTKDLLNQHIDDLRRSISDKGISIENITVNRSETFDSRMSNNSNSQTYNFMNSERHNYSENNRNSNGSYSDQYNSQNSADKQSRHQGEKKHDNPKEGFLDLLA